METLTVIMPVYNSEKYLKEAIESILNQTYEDFKFVIINDNSNDDSQAIIDHYSKKDSRILALKNNTNLGPAQTRNKAINLAQTDLVALMDADDIALPKRFEKQIDFLTKNNDYGVCGTWFTIFGDKKNKTVKHKESHDELKVRMLSSFCLGNPTTMFKKSHLGDLKFETKFVPAEDYGLWSQLIAKTKFHNIQESLLLYRWHANNISQTKEENLRKAEVTIKKKQLINLGISIDNTKINSYLNAVCLKRNLNKNQIKSTIEASKELKGLNTKLEFYNNNIFKNHIDKVILRTIRNSSHYNMDFYKYIKNESGYYSQISTLDTIVLFFKCLISQKND